MDRSLCIRCKVNPCATGYHFCAECRAPKRVCNVCGEEKKLTTQFWHKHQHSKDGFRSPCKNCGNATAACRPKREREDLEGNVWRICRYCEKEKLLSKDNWYSQANGYRLRWECKDCYNLRHQEYYADSSERFKFSNHQYRKKIRLQVLRHYSNGTPSCSCPGCNETNVEFLAIDHIEGGGKKHLEEINGRNLAGWLAIQGFPKGFRVLCHNCNFSRGLYGYCPHESPELTGKLRRIILKSPPEGPR